MLTKKKRRMIKILIPSIIMIVIVAILILLYLTTDMFKSNQTLFFKYLGKNSENVNRIISVLDNNTNNLGLKHYSENDEIKINYTENYGTTSENTENPINKFKIVSNGEVDEENNYQYRDIKLLNEDEKEIQVEYIKYNDEYGIKFTDLFNQYIAIENNNLKDLLKKFDYSDEEIENIPDSIEIRDLKSIGFTNEELQRLKDKYLNLISNKISKDKFSKKSNQRIIINEKNVKANEYSLTLTKEQLNNIYLDILQTIKEDEIILGKIEEIQKISNINISKYTENDLKDIYVNKIEEIIEKINRTNIGVDETKIIVYESQGETISTIIQTTDYEIDFDNLNTNQEMFAGIVIKKGDDETKKITLNKKDNNLELIFKNNDDESPSTITYNNEQEINDKEYKKNINVKYEDESNKIEITYLNILKEMQQQEDFEKFNNQNSIKLNDLNSEQLKAVLTRVNEGFEKEISNLSQKIKIEDIQNMLKNIGLTKEIVILENERGI